MLENLFQKYISAKNIIFIIIAILFLIFVTKIKDVAILFFASYVIACSLNPLVDKLSNKLNRNISSAIVLISTISLLGLFFVPLIALAGHEIKSFIENIPVYIDSLKGFLSATPLINKTQLAQINIGDVISSTSEFTSKFVNQSISLSINVASAVVYFIAATIIIYYFMADKEVVRKGYLSLFPPQMKDRAGEILDTISKKIAGYVIALLTTMSSVGVIMTIGLLLIGVDYAVLLGLITAILDIIPVIGPTIALLICLLAASKMGGLTLLLILVVFAIAQIAENNLVRPYIFGKFLDLHPLIIFLALFITAQFLGVIGVIFAPAIAASVCVLIDELYIKNIN